MDLDIYKDNINEVEYLDNFHQNSYYACQLEFGISSNHAINSQRGEE